MKRMTKKDGYGRATLIEPGFSAIDIAVNRLADYEDTMPLERAQELAQAEKDGRLLLLPCKVGDTVYAITSPINIEIESEETIDIFECKVESITFYSKCSTQLRLFYQGIFVAVLVTVDDFGKTVFLTREEAEAALKKRKDAQQARVGDNMTNQEKFIEVMNETFNAGFSKENMLKRCSPCGMLKKSACKQFSCDGCKSWWDKEYCRKPEEGTEGE